MAITNCRKCSLQFTVRESVLRQGNGKYCGKDCYLLSKRKGRLIPCDICRELSYKQKRDIGRSKSGKFFCSKQCQTIWRNQLYVGRAHKNFTTGKSSYRELLKRSSESVRCKLCHTKDSRVLAAHHIDKNRHNNEVKNLAWLCHNCHFLVHHYEGEKIAFMATIV